MDTSQLNILLNKMSLQEKIFQMTQVISFVTKSRENNITGTLIDLNIKNKDYYKIGSVLGEIGASCLIDLQTEYLKQSENKIPLMFMTDIIHGYKTIFPVPLALGCSFDEKAAKDMARYSAIESASSGLHATFSPMVDLVRDPRWGRVMESTGEDPYLNSVLAKNFVEGYQKDFNSKDCLLSCAKHFIGYGASEGGRDYNTVDISKWQLYENYLPSFKACIDAGVSLVMASFNFIDGIPVTANKEMITELLKKKLGFSGVVISDWGAVKELISHGVAKDEKECARLALEAGIDIEMMTSTYIQNLEEICKENQGLLSQIDQAVFKILELKNKLGLFENPFGGADIELEKKLLVCDHHRKIAKDISKKSIVLLKNKASVLPIDLNKKIALIGPFGETQELLGPWCLFGESKDCVSIYSGLKQKGYEINTAKGCNISIGDQALLNQAVNIAENCDVIVLSLGEPEENSGEAGSLANIQLPECQVELVNTLKKLNKPMVLLLTNGRPMVLTNVVDKVDAILETWFLGTEAGNAIAEVISGDYNPSGKLSISFPYSVGQIPVYYNFYKTGRPKNLLKNEPRYKSCYLDIPNEPLFSFGFGLSYTTFRYSNFNVDKTTHTAVVEVENTGDCFGQETVQLYLCDVVGKVVRPMKQLIGFQKIDLQPKEVKRVTFEINKDLLVYYNSNDKLEKIEGEVIFYIGTNSVDLQNKTVIF